MKLLTIGDRRLSLGNPTYFVADISANHDGDLERARALVHLAREAGADAAKFQNFSAPKIVSKRGFESLGGQRSHQARWTKSVYEVYQDASLPHDWTPLLHQECRRAGIEYFSTPYDFEAVDMLDPYVRAYKVGSGDITWPEMLAAVARKGRPVMLAAGASSMGDVQRAMTCLLKHTDQIVLMQCNTNYTAAPDNFRYIHLNVLRTFAAMYPDVLLGLSDHTPGHATVLGAVALGARVIEKHFTDDTAREGPDHPFSMTPAGWRDMVDRTRELEMALGAPVKEVEGNETETVVVQRRCLRAARDLDAGEILHRADIDVLRPAPPDAIPPYEIDRVVGLRTRCPISSGSSLRWMELGPSA